MFFLKKKYFLFSSIGGYVDYVERFAGHQDGRFAGHQVFIVNNAVNIISFICF